MKTTQELKELLYKNKTVADQQPDAIAEANAFCEGYKAFLNAAKTEREAAAYSEQLLKQAGYKPFVPGMALNAGDKVYLINRGKCVLAATIGERSMTEGFHLNIAHIDSPRLDLGGGGTIAKYVANRDIDTIDIGVPVLAMHSPFEVVSKADVYMAYRTFRAFCADAE